ncbi:putative Agenet-like domain-containing protein [Lupinus albus]|uniref:Putative Agenet-like domain-containing protein n=1 Tax=Lupinus albus TaxID=3870 RepID=A0A6A4Q513_LUPAL|nr:putative Agenet-like domain-containing protein [Lupinus albus]
MRFKKGSKVEVLANTKEFCVEWRCARIISGNGHTYSVQYDGSRMKNEAGVERVPRKAIRPCPPLIKAVKGWEANDVVEVYDDGSWIAAIVLKLIGGDFYLVRLCISCKELEVQKINTRIRQSWHNGEWVIKPVVSDRSGNSGVGKPYWTLISNSCKVIPEVQHVSTEISRQGSNDCLIGLDASDRWEPRPASSTTLKRVSSYCSTPVDAYPRKIRVVTNKGEHERFKAVSTAPLMEKGLAKMEMLFLVMQSL